MRNPVFPLTLSFLSLTLSAQTTPDVGSGAPSISLTQSFIQDYFRNGFNNLVAVPPLGNVKGLGTQGLVQEFADIKNSANKYALIKPNINAPALAGGADMVQSYPAVYSYYTSLGPTTVGYPTTDTLNCPTLISLSGNSCQYQLFDKPYALFAYKNALVGGANFAIANPFYAKWQAIGGINGPGPATTASTATTAASGIAASVQAFDQGAIFNITSGVLSGRLVAVGPGVYATYASNGGYAGFLGLPTTDEQLLPSGHKRQAFENGSIEYDPSGATGPVVRYPIFSINIIPSGQIKLNLGDSVTLTASAFDPNGLALTDRTIAWTTSNSRVVSIQANGLSVTVKAIAGGSATVTASSEAKSSTPITIFVTAPCCGIGEGAPTPALQQAFQDAVIRGHLQVKLPASVPVSRAGSGYVQTVQDAATGVPYLLALSDRSSSAYVLTGAILDQYLKLGGPSGQLGYPTSDANASGRQLFENQAALAGNPVQVVSGAILAKWAALGYEAGAPGLPASAQTGVLSFRATLGSVQSFANGIMVLTQSGPTAGKVFYVGGPIAAAYGTAGSATGALGLPISDASSAGGRNRQDFEGGFVDYAPEDAAAQVHLGDRKPLVTATPSTVLAGTRIRLSVGGFNPGASIRISIAGQTDFVVKTDSGAYAWQVAIPSNAKSGPVAIHAVDTATSASADGSYTVQTAAELVLQLSKSAGDGQIGSPGSLLAQPLDVLVRDAAGDPVVGIPVQFSASPGAQVVSASALTDTAGHAVASVRLPGAEGVALVTAAAGKQLVTFDLQSLHTSLANFPKLSQSNSPATDVPLGNGPDTITQRGALLTSAAAIIRFYQNRGDLPAPNGLADPVVLNQFLQHFCTPDSQGGSICDGFFVQPGSQEQIVNPWRLAAFVGGVLNVSVVKPDLAAVRDILGQGYPVLLATQSDYVVATGVNSDGGIAIVDPNPAFARSTLGDAKITGAILLTPRAPSSSGFVVTGTTAFQLSSPVGACGTPLTLALDDSPGGAFNLLFCDGAQNTYQLDSSVETDFHLTLTDLGGPGTRADLSGAGPGSFAILRVGSQWTGTPQATDFAATGVVNAASYTSGIAPGGLFTVFGSGLSGSGAPTAIQVNGLPVTIVARSPYQISAVVPPNLVPGTYSLTVATPFGTAARTINLAAAAPAIFTLGSNQGAVLNQNGTLNSPDNPAKRGEVIVIYCTGLGQTTRQGALDLANVAALVILSGSQLKPTFAGLAPGFPGLYQVNVSIPLAAPPGLGQAVSIVQLGTSSNSVEVAIQ